MFGTMMTVIIIGYIGYYGYNILHDLYFDKSGEVVATAMVEETEVDIREELDGFTQYDADEDRKVAERKEKEAKEAAENAASSMGNKQSLSPGQDAVPDNEAAVMSGGIEADQLSAMITSLENRENGSDFDIVLKAVTKPTA